MHTGPRRVSVGKHSDLLPFNTVLRDHPAMHPHALADQHRLWDAVVFQGLVILPY